MCRTCRAQQQKLHPGSGCWQPAERSCPSTWTGHCMPRTPQHPASRAVLPPCLGRLGGSLTQGLFCAFYICFACHLTGGFSGAKGSPGCAGAVSRAWGVLLGKSSSKTTSAALAPALPEGTAGVAPAQQHIRPLPKQGFGRGITCSCLECIQSRIGFTSLY